MPPAPQLAISNDFLSSFARIPSKKQNRVIEFMRKFRANPMSPGINYEKIHDAVDPAFRSVRIDDAYRGIVFKPPSGNVYILLWVDQHDDAYDWARTRKAAVHPETGSLQVFESEIVGGQDGADAEASGPGATGADARPGLFDHVHDRHLKRFGVSDYLLTTVRGVTSMSALEALAPRLPREAYEALYFLAEGFSVEEVDREFAVRPDPGKTVDTEDFAAALSRPDSRSRFAVLSDDGELLAMLQAPLEQWRVFLHPSQRSLVESRWSGAVRVLGGAGTGKTVVAMHRAAWLARRVFAGADDRILLTTFTRNLAADIRENLARICPPEDMERIETVNLDRWAAHFLRQREYAFDIVFDDSWLALWEQALGNMPASPDLPASFYREEWDNVILDQGIDTLRDYLACRRIGRVRPLGRRERIKVWSVFEEYRGLLRENGLKEPAEAMHDAARLLNDMPVAPYRAVIVDEAQDMGAPAFRLLRKMAAPGPNDLFIVGDAHQRIYRRKAVLSRCDIQIRGRSRKLRVHYRTTTETRAWAERILARTPIDDLDGGLDHDKGSISLVSGVPPEVRLLDSPEQELDAILDHLQKLRRDGAAMGSICLVARTNNILAAYRTALEERQVPTCTLLYTSPDKADKDGLRLATMHRVKGLEFDHMIIAGANDGVLPYASRRMATDDQAIAQDNETMERCLLYVAATRPRKTLLVTCHGTPSPFLREHLQGEPR